MATLNINLPGIPLQNLASVTNVTQLRARSSIGLTNGENILLDGLASNGDGKGGLFTWKAGSLANDNGISVIRPDDRLPLQGGRWLVVDAGGELYLFNGDGAFNNGPIFAAQTTGFQLNPGTYRVSANTTIGVDVQFLPGAKLLIDSGVTVTFTAGLIAPIAAIFTGAGTANLRLASVDACYLEWWGARAGDGTYDCAPVLQKAQASCNLIHLMPRDYFFASTPQLALHGAKVMGRGMQWPNLVGYATRLVQLGTGHGIVIGPSANPGNINANNLDAVLEDVEVVRGSAPDKAIQPVGVFLQYTQDALIRRVKSSEFSVGFAQLGTVNSRLESCRAVRSVAGTGFGSDSYKGYAVLTGSPPLTDINGNASTVYDDCIAVCGPAVPESVGFFMDGKFTDIRLIHCETASCRYPARIVGDGPVANAASGPTRTNSNVVFDEFWADQFDGIGVEITNLNKWGGVRVKGGYFGPKAGATSCISYITSQGALTVEGPIEMTLVGAPGARAILAIGSRKLSVSRGVVVYECAYRAADLSDCFDCDINLSCSNEFAVLQQAILVSGSTASNTYAPRFSGATNKVTVGVQFNGTTHERSTVNVSSMDRACMPASGADRIVFDGDQITEVSVFPTMGTNLAEGNFN